MTGKQHMHQKVSEGAGGRHGRRPLIIILVVFLVLCLGVVALDVALSAGRIHRGVFVGGVDVGGLTTAEAQQRLDDELLPVLETSAVSLIPDEEAYARLDSVGSVPYDAFTEQARKDTENVARTLTAKRAGTLAVDAESMTATTTSGADAVDTTTEGGSPSGKDTVLSSENDTSIASCTWSVTMDSAGAHLDTALLADKAYALGRTFKDFLPVRFKGWFSEVDLDPVIGVSYEEAGFATFCETVSGVIGIPTLDYNIAVDAAGVASVVEGHTGEVVDGDGLKPLLSQAFFSDTVVSVAAPLKVDDCRIGADAAASTAEAVTAALGESFTILYEGQEYTVTVAQMAPWIHGTVEKATTGYKLVPVLDEERAVRDLQSIMGDVAYGTAVDARFDFSSGVPVIVGGTSGEGPDVAAAVSQMEHALFEAEETSFTLTLAKGTVQPKVLVADLEAAGITERIGYYEMEYREGGNHDLNIEHAADIVNTKQTRIAPGEIWSWTEIVGECDETTGFLDAGVIVDNKPTTASGGGICNLATALYNAAYEAGLPITARTNHSLYLSKYPLGRDATVSWPAPDMAFRNDTQHDIVMSVSYDGYMLYASLWGTSDGRHITSSSYWSGSIAVADRSVYAKDGSLLWSESFYSTFNGTI